MCASTAGTNCCAARAGSRASPAPYHAWTYDLDGGLVRAPRSAQVENFEPQEIRLDRVRVEIFCHLVFVNLDPAAAPLAEQSGRLAQEVMEYAADLPRLTFATRLTYRLEANWKAVVDNFLECYHCPGAHKGFSSMIDLDTYRVTTHGIYSSHMAKARAGANSAYRIEDASVTDHAVWFLWPNTALLRYPGRGNFMVWRFYPVSEQETREEFDFFFATAEPDEREREAIEFIDRVLQPEDIGLVGERAARHEHAGLQRRAVRGRPRRQRRQRARGASFFTGCCSRPIGGPSEPGGLPSA